MLLYSYKNQEPDVLPFRILLGDGTSRTSLNELDPQELKSIGFEGPIKIPEFDSDKQTIKWNGNEYEVINLSEKEIVEKALKKEKEELESKIKLIDYDLFWSYFTKTQIYKKIRLLATESQKINVLYTELLCTFSNAKSGTETSPNIQLYLNILFFILDLNSDEVQELKDIMEKTYLNVLYSVPDKEYLETHVYDFETNKILKSTPFKSWVLIGGKWNPPIKYPNDGKVYKWNEDLKIWVEVF